jgi:hypothetical protein
MAAAASTGADAVTLVIAVVGLILGLTSFVWQCISWSREGPKLRVTTSLGFALGAVPGEHFRIVTVVNVGRSPVEITGWGFELPTKETMVVLNPEPMSTRLPNTLNGGHQAVFHALIEELRNTLPTSLGSSAQLKPYVYSTVHSKVYGKPFLLTRERS